jgi:hypothetical protein
MYFNFSYDCPRRASQILRSSKGLSLVELLVALGILAIVTIALAGLSSQMASDFKTASERVSQEEAADEIVYHLKQVLSNAVELVDPDGDPVGKNSVSNKYGQIAPYELLASWDPSASAPKAEPLALFFRDALPSITITAVPDDSQRFVPIGIYFIRPTPTTYGVLTIDLGDKDTTSLPSKAPALRFTHLVNLKLHDFAIESVANSSGGVDRKVASFMVTFTTRVFKAGHEQEAKWCPPPKMGSGPCVTSTYYHDLTKSFEVVVRNNLLGPSTSRRISRTDPTSGKTYYDPEPRRAIEGVYFLRPLVPVTALNR